MPPETFATLPTRLVDSELGPVPEGWAVGTVADLCDSVTSGGTPSRKNRQYWISGQIDWFKTGELTDGPLLTSQEKITREALENSSCKLWSAGTVLFALYASPTVGRLGVLTQPGTSNQAAAGLVAKAEFGVPFLMHSLFVAREELQRIAVGAAQQNINQGVLKSHRLLIPSRSKAHAFSTKVEPLYELQINLMRESSKLATLRNYLLPRLLSGKVRVSVSQPAIGIRKAAPAPSALEIKPLPRQATDEFKEAILIAALVRALAKPSYPLGRKRYNKIAYFIHRKAEHDVRQHYLKKAAGPYSPWAKYQGPERIAVSNGYIERCKAGQYAGLIAGKNISAIDAYLPRYGFAPAIEWAVTQFRYRKNDDLELLATVDFALIDLRDRSERIDVGTVQELIASEPEWAPKLERAIFSDLNVARALRELSQLFPID